MSHHGLMDRDDNEARVDGPRVEVRPIDIDPDRRAMVDFTGSDGRRPLPAAVKWVTAVAVLMTALIFYVHDNAAPAPTVAPAPSAITNSGASLAASPGQPYVENFGYPLFGAGGNWELFARSTDSLIRIEPAAGRVMVTPVPPLASSAPSTLLAGSTSALIVSFDNVVGYAVSDTGSVQVLPRAVHPNGEPLPGPEPDQVWISDRKGTHLVLVDLSGKKVGPTLTLPHDADVNGFMPDGSGYALVETPHGAYDVRTSGTARVTTGQVLAVNATEWLVGECDKQQNCSSIVVRRATGARKRIGAYTYLSPAMPGVISPDGRHAAVLALNGDGAGDVDLIDLSDGANHLPGLSVDGDATQAMVWSPDSKWLFVADGDVVPISAASGRIAVFDNPWAGDVIQVAVRGR
jgi:hypothetical protein